MRTRGRRSGAPAGCRGQAGRRHPVRVTRGPRPQLHPETPGNELGLKLSDGIARLRGTELQHGGRRRGGLDESAQPDDVTTNTFGPSGASVSRGGEPFGQGATPCSISHRPTAALRSSAHGVSGFQNDLVKETSTRSPLGNWNSTFPIRTEVAVPVGLRDSDAVPGTRFHRTAVVPPACLHGFSSYRLATPPCSHLKA